MSRPTLRLDWFLAMSVFHPLRRAPGAGMETISPAGGNVEREGAKTGVAANE